MLSIKDIQKSLIRDGYNVGAVDGLFGPRSLRMFLMRESRDGTKVPAWLGMAGMELGVREVAGSEDNPRIVEYHRHTSLAASDDEVSWCSSFVNFVFNILGLSGTRSAAARSWLMWGLKTGYRFGAVAVFKRGNSEWQGHVGFALMEDENSILLLGGNQGDAVSVVVMSKMMLLGYRWPSVSDLTKLATGG